MSKSRKLKTIIERIVENKIREASVPNRSWTSNTTYDARSNTSSKRKPTIVAENRRHLKSLIAQEIKTK